jgi:uncharacterized protein
MLGVTNLWGEFRNIPFEGSPLLVTDRLFLYRLEDPDRTNPSLFIGLNALSGAVDILTEVEGQQLAELAKLDSFTVGTAGCPEPFLRQLKDRGYLFPSREVEGLVLASVVNRYKHMKYRDDKIVAFFSLDSSCPMKCEYCFEKKNEDDPEMFEHTRMTPTSLRAAFDTICLLSDLQEKRISFAAGWGGEPLQEKHHELNETFVSLAKERSLPIAYFSNLAMLGKRLFGLLERNAEHIKFLSTTLDATRSQHDGLRRFPGAFDRTVEAISRCLSMGVPITVRTNVGPHNMSTLPDLAEFYHSQGWSDSPNFKSIITRTYDRHHDYEKDLTCTDDEALSMWLDLRAKFPLMRKMETIKLAPSLAYLMKAFWPGELGDFREDEFGVKPLLTYCLAGNRAEYVFTGAPNHSIYMCAECTGLPRFRVGSYYPTLTYDADKKAMWGVQDNDFYAMRSIDSLDQCRTCRAAMLCGGYCALEAIVENGCANRIFCKDAPAVISNFIRNEAKRFYLRSRALLERA